MTLTAWRMLMHRAALRAGESVLVVGAGVNSMAIQIAKLAGASVYVVAANPEKSERARQLGADVVLDRSQVNWGKEIYKLTAKRGVDVVVDNVGKARALGYEIILVYIHLDASELNEARVYQRVTEGGHNVPANTIHSRTSRSMKHIAAVLPLANEARLLDNSYRDNPFFVVSFRCMLPACCEFLFLYKSFFL